MSSLNHLDKIKELMRLTGFARPLILRPTLRRLRKIKGVEVPKSVAEFVSQFSDHKLVNEDPAGLVWSCPYNPVMMHATNRYIPDLEERCLGAIERDGGAVVKTQGTQYFVVYPANHGTLRNFFIEAGFGQREHFATMDEEPLASLIHRPEQMQRRLDEALAIYDGMAAEHAVVLGSISPTLACVKTMGKPGKAWTEKWAARVWDYYVTHKSEAACQPGATPLNSFTKRECNRLARTGTFLIGGH